MGPGRQTNRVAVTFFLDVLNGVFIGLAWTIFVVVGLWVIFQAFK